MFRTNNTRKSITLMTFVPKTVFLVLLLMCVTEKKKHNFTRKNLGTYQIYKQVYLLKFYNVMLH